MSSLPADILVDILSRLPAKDLCRYKCVKKSWLGLISHPRFAKLHLSRNNKKTTLIASAAGAKHLHHLDVETISPEDDFITVSPINFPWSKLDPDRHIESIHCIGCCNGLLCVVTQPYGVVLFNPVTGELNQASPVPNRTDEDPPLLQGFGYVEETDDYLFVKVEEEQEFVEIYSFRNGKWKSVETNVRGYYRAMFCQSVSTNRAVHFVVKFNDVVLLLAFDFVDEEFTAVPMHAEFDTRVYGYYGVGLLNDKLCFSVERKGQTTNQLWVLKEYGVTASWTRVLETEPEFYLLPLCYLGDKIMFLVNMVQVAFIDPKDGKYKLIEVRGEHTRPYEGNNEYDYVYMHMTMESLVSPNFNVGGNFIFFLLCYFWYLIWFC